MLFWTAAAWMLVKRPRGFGLPVAMLTIGSVALQLHYTRSGLAEYVAGRDIQISPEFWVRFWISVTPLMLGGLFAAVSFWIPGRESSRLSRTNLREQIVGGNRS